jgi:Uma2 family endonuclease
MRIEPPIALEDIPAAVLEAANEDPIGPMTVAQYLRTPETHRRATLVHGWLVREADPSLDHQWFSLGLTLSLGHHLVTRNLGFLCPGSIDVILDETTRLVVQPDLSVLLHDRMHFIRRNKRLYGPPNIAIEVRSPSTARRDRTVKLEWYRQYGVQEYWIVDVPKQQIEVFDFTAAPEPVVTTYRNGDTLRSRVLPDFSCPVKTVFEQASRFAYAADSDPDPDERWFYSRRVPRRKR